MKVKALSLFESLPRSVLHMMGRFSSDPRVADTVTGTAQVTGAVLVTVTVMYTFAY